jgi:hypothetical protein
VVISSGLASLPQITNTSTYLNGDAIELANNTVVENLVIVGPSRGGIYGQGALNVTITGNDISGFNTSGGTHGESGINAGWAAILIDVQAVTRIGGSGKRAQWLGIGREPAANPGSKFSAD